MDTEIEFQDSLNLTEIQSFFFGKSVFLTGVTGLVGKVLLEKLLRCCPGIGKIYVHMRPKKGLTTRQRIDKLFSLELFNEVKKAFPLFHTKVQVVEGDITKEQLGLSFRDFETITQNVSVVLHVAASVNFTDPLKMAVENNVIPAGRITKFCHEMPHLMAFIHLSTSYVKREEDGSVLEKVPKTKIDQKKILDALEWLDDNSQEALEKFLLRSEDQKAVLTTYLITKAMAEILIDKEKGDLPVGFVRPCYIGPTWKEPFPGWIDTVQGISGLLLAGAKGALRTLKSVQGLKLNIIPLDIVVNTVIASAWQVGTTRPPSLFIVNCVIDYEKLPNADQKILNYVLTKRDEYPLVSIFRYPHFVIYYNEWAYKLHALIDQWIPAVIVDFFLFIFTGKTILMKVYFKISCLYDIFYRVAKDPWICKLDNYISLRDKLSEKDGEIFYMDTDNLDWEDYMDNCLKGGRKYLARENPSNIPYARKKAKVWLFVTTTLKWLIILGTLYYFLSSFLNLFIIV